jgi:hypothetical protein
MKQQYDSSAASAVNERGGYHTIRQRERAGYSVVVWGTPFRTFSYFFAGTLGITGAALIVAKLFGLHDGTPGEVAAAAVLMALGVAGFAAAIELHTAHRDWVAENYSHTWHVEPPRPTVIQEEGPSRTILVKGQPMAIGRSPLTLTGDAGQYEFSATLLDRMAAEYRANNRTVRRERSGTVNGLYELGVSKSDYGLVLALLNEYGYIDNDRNWTRAGASSFLKIKETIT